MSGCDYISERGDPCLKEKHGPEHQHITMQGVKELTPLDQFKVEVSAPTKQCPKHPGPSGVYYFTCYACGVEDNLAREALKADRQTRYPIAPNGVFWSIQGEGHLRGFQMGFVRLAGCSVGCPQCDTNYSVAEKLTLHELEARCVRTFKQSRDGWVWITGGEPSDHDLRPLLASMKALGYSTAVATSGSKRLIPPVDWLSVSPHSADPAKFQQRYGNEVKLVEGLNGLDINEWVNEWDRPGMIDFMYRYVQPRSVPVPYSETTGTGRVVRYEEDPASLERCMTFLRDHPTWALSRQDHHTWGVA